LLQNAVLEIATFWYFHSAKKKLNNKFTRGLFIRLQCENWYHHAVKHLEKQSHLSIRVSTPREAERVSAIASRALGKDREVVGVES